MIITITWSGGRAIPTIKAEDLREIGFQIFKAAGVPEDEARLVSDFLVRANLDGHDSHGVIRIPPYVERVLEGKIKVGVKPEIIRETPNSAVIDGRWGFGQVVGVRAMGIAIEKAKENTVGIVTVFNCNHVGRLSDYTVMAAENDMVGVAMANCITRVAPYGGMERMLGTCPISFAFPVGEEMPFIFDMATSICAEGKIRVKLHEGKRLPYKCIVDKEGNLSDDPKDLYEGGAILPLGGEVGYKGFGLGLVVEILGGILSGTGCSCSEGFRGGNGLFLEAINIQSFMDINRFKSEIDDMIRRVRNSKPRPGFKRVMTPGEVEYINRMERLKKGIHIPEKTWEELVKTAEKFNLDIEGFIKH